MKPLYKEILGAGFNKEPITEAAEREFTVTVTKRVVFSHTFKVTAADTASAKKQALALALDYGDGAADADTTEWKVTSIK